MKASDIKVGVVYAYRTSPRDPAIPVRILDTQRYSSKGFPRVGDPVWHLAYQQTGSFSSDIGLLGVKPGRIWAPGGTKPFDLSILETVTLGKVLSVKYRETSPLPEGVLATIFNPRYIVGLYDEVLAADAQAKVERDAQNAAARRASDARVRTALRRVNALRNLGLPGTILQPHESPSYARGGFIGNTASVTLSLAQVDALLSLIPEGAHITPASPDA